MNFGDCDTCGEYNYLEENGVCPSCQAERNWVVLFRVPHAPCQPEVIEHDLTQDEAEERAAESYTLTAIREDNI